MKKPFLLLAYAGLIPFIGIPILALSDYLPYYRAFEHFVQYSAIILSFFGGIHWLDALQNQRTNHQLYVAMLPSIIAWLSLVFLQGSQLLLVLSLAYIAILMYDKFTLALNKEIVVSYTFMRVLVTTLVVLSHVFMIVI